MRPLYCFIATFTSIFFWISNTPQHLHLPLHLSTSVKSNWITISSLDFVCKSCKQQKIIISYIAPQTIYLYVGVVVPHGIVSMVASSTATHNTPTSRYFTASTSRYLSLDHETQDTSHTCSRKQPPILFYPFQCQQSTFSTSHTHKDVIHLKIYLTLLFFFSSCVP